MQTGENEQALRKILDMTRLISMILLGLHFYYYGYNVFKIWGLAGSFGDKLLGNILRTGLFDYFHLSKLISLGFLCISLLGAKGSKNEKLVFKIAFYYMVLGLIAYFLSYFFLIIPATPEKNLVLYVLCTVFGYLLMLAGGTLLSRIIRRNLSHKDIFNRENETFPQEERLLENEYSINLPAHYRLKNKVRKSWINIINPFRGILVAGTPGSGKSYFVIRHIITQHIRKGFSMFVYDFKFDDLSIIAYNTWLQNKHLYKVEPKFYVINFDDLSRTHRCNPLDPKSMDDITDAAESARTILLGLNREWIKKQGDFFVESPINFLTAVIWYLRKYNNGAFCTLPHVIELMQVEYNSLFSLLRTEKEIEILIDPFVSAYLQNVMEQLEGQIASAKISMARLSSAQLYYVLSGNDFTLDINNPKDPKIVCMGNNPLKIQTYGAVLSLYVSRLIKQVNQKERIKSSLIFDEFPTIYLNNIDSLIATARSNKVSTCLGIQDFSQLRKDYGREQADVILNITGNIISGQVNGDTAKQLSERFGKIMQDRESISINSSDTSISRSKQLEAAVPASKISCLSSGEFVGITADNPDCKIELKTFHSEIINNHEQLKKEEDAYQGISPVRIINNTIIERNYLQIKEDISEIVNSEMERLLHDPALSHLAIRKKK
ncbi:YWFCY domain-containing protein [Flavobacterium johnsoniae]|uniref:conjugal transfer protein MobC n=1 Tax=Flavobacterium TaxID=237 RepID=UPI0015BF7FEC|nr:MULTISPECIES: conjugal transfer protein MobC [Flavobacterium]NWL02865.1 conjugal transfer protein TraG [Flavobacterium collinsii]WET04008.1 conjugal transfer protein MobC [Flavobacterium sp. YJ01]WJS94495.1 YWFCY domain-containing protein [Flavobacterium johnsoniae]